MKQLVKHFSILAIFFVGGFSLSTLPSFADSDHLDHSGKIRLKTDRIGQDDAQRQKLESQDDKETELEKIAPDLFKKQTRDAIKTKQKEMEETMEQIEKNLFDVPIKEVTNTNDIKKVLFSNEYSVQYATNSNQKNNQQEETEGVSKKIVVTLFGFVLMICGGVFVMMRKMLD
ncbi:type VII secretion protein EssA [Heyndrickxia sporothermodurans]|uniref:type VII secretion protein EssA n=1 Tax=Heyndrickxia sporothermodurans TaxID=46224 RepID=UPI002E1D5CA7|nr:type VII secretion protein EssA [Heyndrickxia sporothermodurans]